MYYYDGKQSYTLELCMDKHYEEWKECFFNVLKINIALLYSKQERVRPQDIDIEGVASQVIYEAIDLFDKFLVNIKGYTKYPMNDIHDGTDTTLFQDVNMMSALWPFKHLFKDIEVK